MGGVGGGGGGGRDTMGRNPTYLPPVYNKWLQHFFFFFGRGGGVGYLQPS